MIRFNLYLIFFSLLLTTMGLQAQKEQGILPTHVYGTADYSGLQQVFDIKTDSRGVVYATNNVGLMELFGNSWKIHKLAENGTVRSLDINSMGRIYVGGENEFGYFDVDSSNNGIFVYTSLSNRLQKTKEFEIGSIRSVLCHNNKTYFRSKNTIYIYENDSIHYFQVKDRLLDLFELSGNIITSVYKKGYYLITDTITELKKMPYKGLSAVVAPYDDSHSLFYSSHSGFNIVSISKGKFRFNKKISTALDSLQDFTVQSIVRINDELYSVGSNKGIFIINKKGAVLRKIDKQYGLKSNLVTSQCIDINNNLWVSTENGIAKIAITSPTEFYTQKKFNYSGRIEDVKRFGGKINIITPSGLFILDQSNGKSYQDKEANLVLVKFGRIQHKPNTSSTQTLDDSLYEQLNNSCWDLELFTLHNKKLLLVSTNDYVIGINKNGSVEKLASCFPYTSYQSRVDPRRVYIGLDGGFQSVYYSTHGKWINEGLVEGINEVINDIAEDSLGNLWLATNRKGVIVISKPKIENHKMLNPKITRLYKGLESSDPLRIELIDNKLLFASSFGIYDLSWSDSTFILDSSFSESINSYENTIHRLSHDRQTNLWAVAIENNIKVSNVFYLQKTAENKYNNLKVFAKKDELINSFYHDKNDITWFGGTYGLGKIDAKGLKEDKPIYYTYLTTILNNSDTAFGGNYHSDEGPTITQPQSYIKTFDFQHNSFTFYFSASSPKDFDVLKYSWYLEGYEHEQTWGSWSDKTYKEYTNLNEGQYTFHVQAVDIYGNLSQVSSYSFNITPPWYRTIWAFLSYIIFFITFVWGAIRISTRSLKRIIKDATAEIREQKDQLEEKNQNIIDSIRYAQRIQEAVTPSDALFHQYFKNSFVLWKPRDIVSGDFYWLAPRNNQLFIAAADCTGHGVPGAFMSIMGISFLNQIVGSPDARNAAEVLNMLRHNVITALNKEQSGATSNKDGMDIALCIFDFEKKQIEYSGAYNSLYVYREGKLLETKADRMPIGVHTRDQIPFKNHVIDLQSGDQVYLFSDGYIDQFGGPKGKKYMTKRFKKLLLEITNLSMEEQKEYLWKNTLEWRGEIEQVDDIIIIGIRIE